MSTDPQILALIIRRVRQLKKVKYAPAQHAIIEYVCDRVECSEDSVREQLKLAVENGELLENVRMIL